MSISAVRVSELEGYRRVDAEYYQPHYLALARRFERSKSLGESQVSLFHPAEVKRVYEEEGLQLLFTQNIRANRLDLSHVGFLPFEVEPEVRRNKLEPGDVMVTRTGANFGDAAPYDGSPAPLYASAHCIVIRSKTIPGTYLSTYFNTDIGRALVKRGVYGAAQPEIAPDYLRTLRIPRDARTEKIVEEKLKQSKEKFRDSVNLYAQAQALLAAELGLDKLDLSESLYSVRRVSEVRESGRADAEYYKPKYQRLLKHLQNTKQAVRLGNWVSEPVKRGVQPEYTEDGDIAVINSQHVGKTHVELGDNRATTREFCEEGSNKRALVRQYDVLLNSTGYITIGRCQPLLDDVKAIVDGHVSIIRPKPGLDPVYLALYLNALPGQLQTERGWTGSSGQIELRTDVIADFMVWQAPNRVQQKIRQLVEQSQQARQDAQRLLAEAQAHVERMIEGA